MTDTSKMTFKDYFNGKTISDYQRRSFPGEYNRTVAWARRGFGALCALSFLACAGVVVADVVVPHLAKPASTETLTPQ